MHFAVRVDGIVEWANGACGRIAIACTRDADDVTCKDCLESHTMAVFTGRLLRRIGLNKLA